MHHTRAHCFLPLLRFTPAVMLLALAMLLGRFTVPPAPPDPLAISHTTFQLHNGLRVILHEDHSLPLVTVNIWYRTGSRDDPPGRSGLAHLVEHMMFHPTEYYHWNGGHGATRDDTTDYFTTGISTGPSSGLALWLWIEAFRMSRLRHELAEETLSRQRRIVVNEKRQNYDNRPYGLAWQHVAAALYPAEHPYHRRGIGQENEVAAASLQDVKQFLARHYVPNKASLVVAGDFDAPQVRRLIEKYFALIPRGPAETQSWPAAPQLRSERRLTMTDRVSLPRLYMVWPTVSSWHEDEAALDVLAAVLDTGKSGRLEIALGRERKLAQSSSASHSTSELAGMFYLVLTALPGQKLSDLEAAADDELARLKEVPPTLEEVERARSAREASYVFGVQELNDKADLLNEYAASRDAPGTLRQDLARYRRVTAADVRRVARRYLTGGRVVLRVVPPGYRERDPAQTASAESGAPSKAEAEIIGAEAAAQTAAMETAAQTRTSAAVAAMLMREHRRVPFHDRARQRRKPRFSLPHVRERRLANGLRVLLVERRGLPIVNLHLLVRTGAAADPPGRAGLSSLTAAMLGEGTTTRSEKEIAGEWERIGARFSSWAQEDSTSATLQTLSYHLDRALAVYADVVTRPSFPANELERLRHRLLASSQQGQNDTFAITARLLPALTYGGSHPYGRLPSADEARLKAVQADELRRFHSTYYRPNDATLIVVGDAAAESLWPRLERAFGHWRNDFVPAPPVPPVRAPGTRPTIYLVDRPGATQSVVSVAGGGAARSSADFFPLLVLGKILSGGPTSRLVSNLRESKAITYSAYGGFHFRRAAGHFAAGGAVQTDATAQAVEELLKELRDIRGAAPITGLEIDWARDNFAQAVAFGLQTSRQVSWSLADAALHDLPNNFIHTYLDRVLAVSPRDLQRVAGRYIQPSRTVVLVVGDVKAVGPSLRLLAQKRSHFAGLANDARWFADDALKECQPLRGGSGLNSRPNRRGARAACCSRWFRPSHLLCRHFLPPPPIHYNYLTPPRFLTSPNFTDEPAAA